jgi:hypothetical protein
MVASAQATNSGKAAIEASAAKPQALPVNTDGIPSELRQLPQWVGWRYERRKEKWTKVPVSPTGSAASATDPKTWAAFDQAFAAYCRHKWDGIGFVFSTGGGFAGVDLDDCRDPKTGTLAAWAAAIVSDLDSYTEVSPSGTGVKVFLRGAVPVGGNRRGNVEMYDHGRYFALTGQRLDGSPPNVNDRGPQLAELHRRVFDTASPPPGLAACNGRASPNRCTTRATNGSSTFSDDELVRRASADANGDKFTRLWSGDTSGYDSDSEADLALCRLLAFWTGPDPERIDRLFRQSGLMRNKWDERRGEKTYGQRTIAKADSDEARPAHKKVPQAEQLLELAAGQDYFQARDGRAFATVAVDDNGAPRRETLSVRRSDFRNWLARLFYRATGKAPSDKTMQEVLGVLDARARYDGPMREVFCRVGGDTSGNIYIDLCDSQWRAIVITASGWQLVDTPPVRFRRARGMLPLAVPVCGGSLDQLRQFVNIRDEDWPLLVGWLLAAFRPIGPYPVLCLHGEQGSAKSTTARVLRCLVDPSMAPLRAEPRDERDLAIAASNSWLVALDNLSYLSPWLSDALCRLSTGGGFATRALYSDNEEAIFDAQRPVLLTGIEDLATRPDLLDRAIVLSLPAITEEVRLPEREFWQRFEAARPRIMGALCNTLSGALCKLPDLKLPTLPRMADFAVWATAGSRALGWDDDAFLGAYLENMSEAVGLALDNSPVVGPLSKLLDDERGTWQGTCQELLDRLLKPFAGEEPPKNWPRTARALSGALRRLAPALRKTGIEVEFLPREGRVRPVRIQAVGSRGNNPATDRHDRHQPSPTDSDGDGPMTVSDGCDGAKQTCSPRAARVSASPDNDSEVL